MNDTMEERPNDTMEERPNDTMEERPTPLPPDVLGHSEPALRVDLPLHLRVLAAIVEGQTEDGQRNQQRLHNALELAHEIYELETANVALENYRSS